MKLLFNRGDIEVKDAEKAVATYSASYEANILRVNAQSVADYVMPRESNQHEGYIRFLFPENERVIKSNSELHLTSRHVHRHLIE